MTVYTNSITEVSVTIANGATSGTATITAVGSNAFLIYQGKTITKAASVPNTNLAKVVLTNSTTITATRNTSDASNSIVVKVTVIDPTSNLVTGIQAGTITITSGTSNTATITSVDTTLSSVFYLGETSTHATLYGPSLTGVTLTNATTVTANLGQSGTATVSYVVVTFATAAIKSIQQFSTQYTQSTTTTDTQTITSVVTGNSMIGYGGFTLGSGNVSNGVFWITLTNATTVTLTRNAAGVSTRNSYYTVIEFASGVLLSTQRGSVDLASVASNTATISSVTTVNAFCTFLNFSGNIATSASDTLFSKLALTNATTVTATKNTAGATTLTTGYEVIEFTNVAGISFDAASNSGYQTAQSTYSWNHTVTGINTYLVVGIGMLSVAGSSVSGITFNGISMDFLGAKSSVSGALRSELWGQIAPTTGTHSIAVTLSTGLDSAGGAVSFTGVNQSSATEAFNSAQATNVGAADATVSVTTVADNDWVIDCTATDDTAITVGSSGTSRSNVTGTLGSGAVGTVGPKTPAGSQARSWTNVDALKTWAIGAIALRPITASNLASKVFRKTLSGIGTKVGVRQVQGW